MKPLVRYGFWAECVDEHGEVSDLEGSAKAESEQVLEIFIARLAKRRNLKVITIYTWEDTDNDGEAVPVVATFGKQNKDEAEKKEEKKEEPTKPKKPLFEPREGFASSDFFEDPEVNSKRSFYEFDALRFESKLEKGDDTK
jgi:hypothetical protein